VVATVVSTPAADRAVIDAGSKALAADSRLSLLRGYGIVPGCEDLVLERMSEEHGMLVATAGRTRLRIGDRLVVVPAHCCTTVNLHPAVLMVELGRAWWTRWRRVDGRRRRWLTAQRALVARLGSMTAPSGRAIAVVSVHASPLSELGRGENGGMNLGVRRLCEGLAERGVPSDVFVRRDDPDLPAERLIAPGAGSSSSMWARLDRSPRRSWWRCSTPSPTPCSPTPRPRGVDTASSMLITG